MIAHSPVTEMELIMHSKAPRVTEHELDEAIDTVHFINAGDAVERITGGATASEFLLTLCLVTLKNGFVVTGESACASPENFNKEIGQRIAYEDAKRKIWPLLGYALRDKLAREQG